MPVLNGKILSAFLGFEHGILTASLTIEDDGAQAFGGRRLDGDLDHNYVGKKIGAMLTAIGAKEWAGLKGTLVRTRRDKPFGPILAIGHIMKDQWFTWEPEN